MKPIQFASKTSRTVDRAAQAVEAVERAIANGDDVKNACRDAGVSVPSFYRWRARTKGAASQPDRSYDAILAAAKMVFLREGFAANLDSVAKAAGVARQTVYNQFGSKERLFSEVVQSVYQGLAAPMLVVQHGDDFRATLVSFGRVFMQMALNPESLALQRVALGEYRASPELAKVSYALRASHAIPVITDVIANYLREQMGRGVIDKCDPLMAAEAFAGSFTAHARHRILIGIGDDTPERQEAMLQLCVKVFAKGLGYRDQPTV
jgi:AcrR family transcriptional regulator